MQRSTDALVPGLKRREYIETFLPATSAGPGQRFAEPTYQERTTDCFRSPSDSNLLRRLKVTHTTTVKSTLNDTDLKLDRSGSPLAVPLPLVQTFDCMLTHGGTEGSKQSGR